MGTDSRKLWYISLWNMKGYNKYNKVSVLYYYTGGWRRGKEELTFLDAAPQMILLKVVRSWDGTVEVISGQWDVLGTHQCPEHSSRCRNNCRSSVEISHSERVIKGNDYTGNPRLFQNCLSDTSHIRPMCTNIILNLYTLAVHLLCSHTSL